MLTRTCNTNAVTRPQRSGGTIESMLDQLFETPFGLGRGPSSTGTPAIDAFIAERGFVLRADLPGFSLEDLDISIVGRELVISGSRTHEFEENVQMVLGERPSGSFKRAFRLPFDVQADEATATLTNGVLGLTVQGDDRGGRAVLLIRGKDAAGLGRRVEGAARLWASTCRSATRMPSR